MLILPLYRYTDEENRIIDSLAPPEGAYAARVRIVAEEGKLLSKIGHEPCPCIDQDSLDGWTEIDIPEDTDDELVEESEDSNETEGATDDGV